MLITRDEFNEIVNALDLNANPKIQKVIAEILKREKESNKIANISNNEKLGVLLDKTSINIINTTAKNETDDLILIGKKKDGLFRQAIYFYLMKTKNKDRKELLDMIRNLYEYAEIPFNRGVIIKELQVAEYCLQEESIVDILNSQVQQNSTLIESVENIREYMQKKEIRYNRLHSEGYI